jgi:hypothetical protein
VCLRADDPRSPACAFRDCLFDLNEDVTCLVLSRGVDADGTVHEDEYVIVRRLSAPTVVSDPDVRVAPAFHRRRDATTTTTPSWLEEAERDVANVVAVDAVPPVEPVDAVEHVSAYACMEDASVEDASVEQPSAEDASVEDASVEQPSAEDASAEDASAEESSEEPSEEPSAEQPSEEPSAEQPSEEPSAEQPSEEPSAEEPSTEEVSAEDVESYETRLYTSRDAEPVATLSGVLTPDVFRCLAQSNVIAHVPTSSASRIPVTRVRDSVWVGMYVLQADTWDPRDRSYLVSARPARSQMAPARGVVHLHRIRKNQFERR